MDFGKGEMAARLDVRDGKRRRYTPVRQFPDVITDPCSRAKHADEPEILLHSAPWRAARSELQRGFVVLLLARFFTRPATQLVVEG